MILSNDEVVDRVRRLVARCAPEPPAEPPRDQDKLVDDLGYHSLAFTELAVALGDELGVDGFDSDEAQQVQTVRDVIDLALALVATSAN